MKTGEYHAGTGKGGRQLVGRAGVAVCNNVTTFAGSGGGFENINQHLSFLIAGARGDASADDNAAIQRALDLAGTGCNRYSVFAENGRYRLAPPQT